MNRLLSHNLWPTIAKLAKGSLKRAAIAYVSSDEYIQFEEGDLLVCDASPNAIKSAQTSAAVLKRAFERGAALYSLPALHSKVVLLNEKALIGSANASESSARSLVEIGLLTDQPTIVAMAQDLVRQLTSQATPLTRRRIDQLLSIEVISRPRQTGTPRRLVKASIGGHRTWIVGTTEIVKDFPEDQDVVAATAKRAQERMGNPRSSVSWVRWTGRSKFRMQCREGDWVIQMWKPHGKKLPSEIYERMPVLDREDFETASYIYYEEFPKADARAKGWSEFKKLAHRAGVAREIKPGSHFEITEHQADLLQELWTEK